MPLSENSPFSVLVLLRKNILAFFQGSSGFQGLKEQGKKVEQEGSTERRNPGLGISALSVSAPASTARIHVSDQYLYPQNFIAIY